MQFNSYIFILVFLPLTVIGYYIANRLGKTIGKLVLIAAGIVFYALGRSNMLIYLGASMVINYAFSLLISKKKVSGKLMVAVPVAVNVLLLLYFKYTNFAITNINTILGKEYALRDIVLPLGISFYTFSQIAYVVAVGRKEIEKTDLIDYVSYILFFPKLVMGPLMEPVDFIQQLNDDARKKVNMDEVASGLKIFSLGLIKKVLIADTFAKGASWVYTNLESATSFECLLLMLFYTFEIYFDFSGYSDMAVGVSSLLGIDLPINFDSPYKAISIRDFWKRWHISLTKFLTKYVYIPLGGSRKGKAFTCINTMIVFLVSGVWHGANWTFILWGALHGLLSVFDRVFEKVEERIVKPVRWLLTFIAVNVLWLLFSAESVSQWVKIIINILRMRTLTVSDGLLKKFAIPESKFLLSVLHLGWEEPQLGLVTMIVFVAVTLLICILCRNNYEKKDSLGMSSMIFASLAFVFGILCLGNESVFVYFGF